MSIARVMRNHWFTWLTTINEIATIMLKLMTIFFGEERPRNFGEKTINSPGTLLKENVISICRSLNPRLLIACTWTVENHRLALRNIVK